MERCLLTSQVVRIFVPEQAKRENNGERVLSSAAF